MSNPLEQRVRVTLGLGVAANRGAVVVGLWPANAVTDDGTTLAVVAEDEIGHEVTRGHPQKLNSDLRFEEV